LGAEQIRRRQDRRNPARIFVTLANFTADGSATRAKHARDKLPGMRRFHAIVVMVTLLATPLALLARSGAGDACQCCGAYCPMRHAHSSQHQKKMMCGSMLIEDQTCHCTTKLNDLPDYGWNTLMSPTTPSVRARIRAPGASRRVVILYAEFSVLGLVSLPFKPPRS
jgi:hypothetical protein